MDIMRAALAAFTLSAGMLPLAGCAVVDQYSDRAVVYNVQAEQAQNQALLLNIVRASMRRPMQFTTVSSITGTASASGGAQYTVPVNVPFRPPINGATGIASYPALTTWNFAGSFSGGPAFSVPVLDTQEFYDGILKPISGQLYDLYLQAGYPRDLLFNLFVQKITMTRADDGYPDPRLAARYPNRYTCAENSHQPGCEFTFENYAGTNLELALFQALGDYLLALGFSTEAARTPEVDFSPPIQNINIRYIGAPSTTDKNLAQVVAPPGGTATSPPEAAPKQFGFCFTPRDTFDADCIGGLYSPELCGQAQKKFKTVEEFRKYLARGLYCSGPKTSNTIQTFFPDLHSPAGSSKSGAYSNSASYVDTKEAATLQTSGVSKVTVIVSDAFAGMLRQIANDAAAQVETKAQADQMRELANQLYNFGDRKVVLTFTLRSTEGMIYYLGEIARRQLAPDYGDRGPIFVKEGPPYAAYRQASCIMPGIDCQYLFVLKNEIPSPKDFLSAFYEGQWYSIPGGRDGGLSSQVVDLVRQLIAINSSAKSLPQSSVISLVGGQ